MIISLLTLTMPTRALFLAQLRRNIEPQLVKGIEWKIRMCHPTMTLGENRDVLRREAIGEYIAFIDDDDCVPYDYVSSILPPCDGVDQIGFNVKLYMNGVPDPKLSYQSLRYGDWYDDENGYYRDISHINPMLRELALSEPMEGGHGEDKRWADRMRGKVKTEHYVDKVLYYYLFRSGKNSTFSLCPKCQSEATVRLEDRNQCNKCGWQYDLKSTKQKSCLWT